MRLLYVFPHPDDESFGPALAIARQRRDGHEVHLLTLTRGGATKVRHELGLTVEEMGRVRLDEMGEVEKVLGLSSMTVLDFPDAGLKEVDPRELEEAVAGHVRRIRPHVLVTYPVHGISGFHDHLVSHAVVKRAFCELRERDADAAPRRLAFFTVAESERPDTKFSLETSAADEIDCEVAVGDEEVELARRALDCYETYREVIREADPLSRIGRTVYFELFQKSHDPRLASLTEGL